MSDVVIMSDVVTMSDVVIMSDVVTMSDNSATPTSTLIVDGSIPITDGNSAVITYFTDTVYQCISGEPLGNALAVNPILLGFTESDWTNLYSNANPSVIPWCGKTLTVTVNGVSFTGEIIDTCDPTGNTFVDPNTGLYIGGKCDYTNCIDLYGQPGLDFLNNVTNGGDFFDGNNVGLMWSIQ